MLYIYNQFRSTKRVDQLTMDGSNLTRCLYGNMLYIQSSSGIDYKVALNIQKEKSTSSNMIL